MPKAAGASATALAGGASHEALTEDSSSPSSGLTVRCVACYVPRSVPPHCTVHMPPHCTCPHTARCTPSSRVHTTPSSRVRTRYAHAHAHAHMHTCVHRVHAVHAQASWCVCTPTVFAVTCICRAELTLARVVCVRVCACVLRAPCRAPRAFPHRPRTCLAHRHRHRGSWYVAWRVMFHAPCPRTVRCTPCVRTPHHRHVCARVTHACVHHVRALCSGGCSQPAHSGLLMGLLMGRRAGIGVAPGRWCLL